MASKDPKMSKRAAVGKRKHATLTISQKLQINSRLECGTNCSVVTASYNTGLPTIYDIQKQEDQLRSYSIKQQCTMPSKETHIETT